MESKTFNTRCPNCFAPYENLGVELDGRKARCVKCKKLFVLKRQDDDDSLLRPADPDVVQPRAKADERGESEFAPTSNYDESELLNTTSSVDSSLASSRRTPFGDSNLSDSSESSFSDSKSEDSFGCSSEPFDEYLDYSPADFARQFPDPLPKGVWRPGELLLDGMCLVLPLAPDKIYAEGGVGMVQRVRRRDWNIDLIVKSPKPGVILTESGKQAFERECQTWIELGLHSNIVSCYFVRRIDGVPRLFAELAPDGTLKDWIFDKRLYAGSTQEALARILDFSIQFAWGLEHAHSRGLLHLDVKPGNVMISGETVKVTDFGLSKFTAESSAEAPDAPDSFCEGMTPSYCSPEQYEAFKIFRERKRKKEPKEDAPAVVMTKQSDVWSWAISVLAMFHGRSPCKMGGQTAAEVFEIFLKNQKPDERPLMPPKVVELIRHCFQKNPSDRPESMQYIADRLVEAYEETIGVEYPRRQPQNAALTGESFSNKAISLLDLGKTQEALSLLRDASNAEPNHPLIAFNHTLTQWRTGRVGDMTATRRLEELALNQPKDASARYALGLLHMERGNLKSCVNAFERALELDPKRNDVRRSLSEARQLMPLDAQCLTQYVLKRVDEKTPPALFISEDGDFLIMELVDDRYVIVGATNGATLMSFPVASSGKTLVSEDYRWNLVFKSDRVAVVEPASIKGEFDPSMKIRFRSVDWGARRERTRRAIRAGADDDSDDHSKGSVSREIVFTPTESFVVARAEGTPDRKFGDENHSLTAYAVASDGDWLAEGDDASQIRVWNVDQKRCARTFQGLGGAVEAIWFDSQKRYVAALTKGNVCQFFGVSLLCNYARKIRAPYLLCLVNSSEELLKRRESFDKLLETARAANESGDIRRAVESYRQARGVEGWEATRSEFEAILDRRADRVAIDGFQQTSQIHAHDSVVSAIATPWNGAFLATAGKDAFVRLWAPVVETLGGASVKWSLKYELAAHYDWVRVVALSPNERFLASGSWDQRVILWNLATGKRLATLPEKIKSPTRLAFAPDGRALAVATANGNVALWDLAQTRALLRLHVGDGETRALVFSRDGSFFATSTTDGFVRLWSGRSSLAAREIGPFPGAILALDLSFDGRRLVAGCANGKIYVVDLTTDSQKILPGHLGEVGTLRLFADNRRLVSTGKDKFIRFWDLETGKEEKQLSNPDGEISDLALDFSGRNFYVASENGYARQWSVNWDYGVRKNDYTTDDLDNFVASLARNYVARARTSTNATALPAGYGLNATFPPIEINPDAFDESTLRILYEEARYRGMTAATFRTFVESFRRAARLKWKPIV